MRGTILSTQILLPLFIEQTSQMMCISNECYAICLLRPESDMSSIFVIWKILLRKLWLSCAGFSFLLEKLSFDWAVFLISGRKHTSATWNKWTQVDKKVEKKLSHSQFWIEFSVCFDPIRTRAETGQDNMAEGTYEYECSRAELLGNAPPNYEDWQAADKVKREQQQAEEATVRHSTEDRKQKCFKFFFVFSGIGCARRENHRNAWQNGWHQ